MKTRLAAAGIALALGSAVLSGCASTPPQTQEEACATFSQGAHSASQSSYKPHYSVEITDSGASGARDIYSVMLYAVDAGRKDVKNADVSRAAGELSGALKQAISKIEDWSKTDVPFGDSDVEKGSPDVTSAFNTLRSLCPGSYGE